MPNGIFELRFNSEDRVDKLEYETAFHSRFPSFVSFFNWAMSEVAKNGIYSGSLDLSGLTSAKDLVLPKSIGGWLDLRSEVREELNRRKK